MWINLLRRKLSSNPSDGLVLKQSTGLDLITNVGGWFQVCWRDLLCYFYRIHTDSKPCFGLVLLLTSTAATSVVYLNLQDLLLVNVWWMMKVFSLNKNMYLSEKILYSVFHNWIFVFSFEGFEIIWSTHLVHDSIDALGLTWVLSVAASTCDNICLNVKLTFLTHIAWKPTCSC